MGLLRRWYPSQVSAVCYEIVRGRGTESGGACRKRALQSSTFAALFDGLPFVTLNPNSFTLSHGHTRC